MKKTNLFTNILHQFGEWMMDKLLLVVYVWGRLFTVEEGEEIFPRHQNAVYVLKLFVSIIASIFGTLLALGVIGKL